MRNKSTLLVVDDDETDIFLVHRACEKAGNPVDIQSVNSGQEAVDYLVGKGKFSDREKYPLPDLMLLDIKMPGMTGFDVLRWMRDVRNFKSLRVVVTSSSSLQGDINLAYELGANAYLTKPVNLGELFTMFEKLTEFFTKFAAKPDVRQPALI